MTDRAATRRRSQGHVRIRRPRCGRPQELSASTTPTWCTSRHRLSPREVHCGFSHVAGGLRRRIDSVRPTPPAKSSTRYNEQASATALAIKKISGGNTLHGPVQLGGVTDQYFAAVFIPDDPQNSRSGHSAQPARYSQGSAETESAGYAPRGGAGSGGRQPARPDGTARLYVGPKALKVAGICAGARHRRRSPGPART